MTYYFRLIAVSLTVLFGSFIFEGWAQDHFWRSTTLQLIRLTSFIWFWVLVWLAMNKISKQKKA